jgi:hypothetical protein
VGPACQGRLSAVGRAPFAGLLGCLLCRRSRRLWGRERETPTAVRGLVLLGVVLAWLAHLQSRSRYRASLACSSSFSLHPRITFPVRCLPSPHHVLGEMPQPRGGKSELARLLLSSLLRCRVLLSSGGVASGALCFALIGVLDDTRS